MNLFAEIAIEAASTTNPLLDKNGQFVAPEEAIDNFAKLWKEWDLIGKIEEKLPTIILALAVILFGFLLASLTSKILMKAMKRRKVDFAVYNFIGKMIRFVIRVTFVLIALSMFIKINSLIAALGAAGVAIGLGLQDSVSQFASGLQVLFNHPFRAGDYVEVDGVAGSVVEIGFMQTIIVSLDNKRIIIPNSDLTKNHIINYSAEGKRRVDLKFAISYSDDIARAKAVVMAEALSNVFILSSPEPKVFVNAHGASSVELLALVWCQNENYWDVYFSMQEAVKLAFDQNGISIPFQQLDVHIVEPQ